MAGNNVINSVVRQVIGEMLSRVLVPVINRLSAKKVFVS